ncbi:MAG: hypothetical protein WHT09_13860 [Thermogutta sp.]
MPTFEAQSDAGFYELVNRILMRSDARSLQERRIRPRMEFDTEQRIAPWVDKSPSEGDFITVRCFDLNKGGIAFFLDEPPPFRKLVVELKCPQKRIYVLAEVAHYAPVLLYPNGDIVLQEAEDVFEEEDLPDLGQPVPKILVGCRFLSRWTPCEGSGTSGTSRAASSSG